MSKDSKYQVRIERKGGLAAFGQPSSRIRSRGALDLRTLSPADRTAIEKLFTSGPPTVPSNKPLRADAFEYHLTMPTPNGDKTIIASEDDVPEAVRDAVEDELG